MLRRGYDFFFAGIRTQKHIDEITHPSHTACFYEEWRRDYNDMVPWATDAAPERKSEGGKPKSSLKHEAMQNHDPAFQ